MSAARLALHQFRYDQKMFWRNPASVFFTVALPLIFLVIFATIFGNDKIEELDDLKTTTYYIPAILTLGGDLGDHAEPGLPAHRRPRQRDPEARPRHADAELGLLRRPDRQLPRRLGADAGHRPGDRPAALRSRDSVGSPAGRNHHPRDRRRQLLLPGDRVYRGDPERGRRARRSPTPSLLPLYFLSGIFIPETEIPDGVLHFADAFPIRHFFEAFFAAWDPATTGSGFEWGDLAVVAAWGALGLVLAIRFFRWTPTGRLRRLGAAHE